MSATRTGSADSPLHGGHCPPWLFARMQRLAAVLAEVVVIEFGTSEFLRRLADPIWFQAFGAVLGFDWHSSGLTTVVCGALKEGTAAQQGELGLFFAGGKGAQSRQTPAEITAAGERYALRAPLTDLQRSSRLAAKVDSAALQDGFPLYHHFFAFDRHGAWAVVQQGMHAASATARRYHWLGEAVTDFTDEPHAGISGAGYAASVARRVGGAIRVERRPEGAGPATMPTGPVLNMVAHASLAARTASLDVARQPTAEVLRDLDTLRRLEAPAARVAPSPEVPTPLSLFPEGDRLVVARPHPIPHTGRIDAVLTRLYERPPADYAGLLLTPGVGPATVRALAMVAEVAYGARPSRTDPVRYAFAHGGKDGHPFPVRRRLYDNSIQVLQAAVEKAKMGDAEQMGALRRLAAWGEEAERRSATTPHGRVTQVVKAPGSAGR